MKKIFFSALAALSLAACVQEAMVDVPQSDAIAFEDAFIDNATRAADDPSFNINTLNAFKVWAYVNAPDGVVFKGKEVSRTGAGAPWTYDGTQYWAPGKPYYFEAIAPAEGNWELATNDADPTVLSFTNANGTEDLLYASTQQTGAAIGTVNESVKFSFGHLLSKVKFTFNNGFLTDNVTVKVTAIQMDAPKSGKIDLSQESAMAWAYDTNEKVTLEFGDVEDLTLDANSKECADERFTIPGLYDYTISFNLEIVMGAQPVYNEPKTSTVSGVKLEMGKAYNFVAEISPATLDFEAIEFEVVEVEEWITSGQPANDAQVTEAEIQAAAQLGGSYTLADDVVLTSPVVVPAGSHFVLNLNGMTLKNQVDNAATDVIIVEEGAELVINGEGTGTVEAVSGNDGYAVIAEGKVTINGGTYKSGVDQNNEPNAVVYARGKGEVYVNGGYFPNEHTSKYVLNKKDADRSTTVIEVRGGTFQNFNPADNAAENPGTNFVAEGYTSVADGDNYVVVYGKGVATADELRDAIKDAENDCIIMTEEINLFNTSVSYLHINHDVTVNMFNNTLHVGDAANYGLFCNAGSNVSFENANIVSHGGGIVARDGAEVTVNNGSIKIESTSTSHRHMIYASGEGTTVTINDGNFSFDQYRKRTYGYVANGAIVYIKGGEFGPAPNHPSDPNKPFMVDGGQIIITGGTFGFDPSAWVAPGYKAVKNGSNWTVVAE